jgi:hypothetical protein
MHFEFVEMVGWKKKKKEKKKVMIKGTIIVMIRAMWYRLE